MNQYTMIEKALSEHKRLSTITGAQLLSISIVIHNDMEYDGSVCIGVRVESIVWYCGSKRGLTFSYFRKDGSLIDSLRGC